LVRAAHVANLELTVAIIHELPRETVRKIAGRIMSSGFGGTTDDLIGLLCPLLAAHETSK